jgi:hypothetical protein
MPDTPCVLAGMSIGIANDLHNTPSSPPHTYTHAMYSLVDLHPLPPLLQVDVLVEVLSSKRVGVVAHFYMDPQVQGVLTSAGERWPHIAVSDSLVMADTAVRMAEAGCRQVKGQG